MRSPRLLPFLVTFGFLTLAFASLLVAPGATAKTGSVTFDDPTGDVALTATRQGPPPPNSGGLDVKAGSMSSLDGRTLLIRVEFVDLFEESNYPPATSGGDILTACFTWNDVLFGAEIEYYLGQTAHLTSTRLGRVTGTCDITKNLDLGGKFKNAKTEIDEGKQRMSIAIDRVTLGALAGTAPPAAGDKIGKLWIIVSDQKRNRFDVAPNDGPNAEDLVLTTGTTNNADFRAAAITNVLTPIPCEGRVDAPTYVVDAGGIRGVPISLMNEGDASRKITFTVETMGGKDWKPRIVPQLDVSPASAGNTTVTVIVEMPASTTHKDCSIIHVIAADAADPSILADATVSVFAVRPPDEKAHKLFLHADKFANACSPTHMWLNIIEEDPATEGSSGVVRFTDCKDPAFAAPASTSGGTLQAGLDVNPSRDLVVNTSATDKVTVANLSFRSETSVKTRITASLLTARGDGDLIGEGRVDTTINGATKVEIPIIIGFTRDEVPTGDPSRIVASDDGIRLVIRIAPLPADSGAGVAKGGSEVKLMTKGSYVDIPIFATMKRNHIDPGAAGSLLSVKPVGTLPGFAVPGSARLFNYTVLNEGALPDVALITGSFTGGKGGWTATFAPGDKITLGPGESKVVQAVVAVPATAPESEAVVFDFQVSSETDPTAKASVATKVIASNEAGVPREMSPNQLGNKSDGFLPSPGPLAAIAALAVGLATWRRRRAPPQA